MWNPTMTAAAMKTSADVAAHDPDPEETVLTLKTGGGGGGGEEIGVFLGLGLVWGG